MFNCLQVEWSLISELEIIEALEAYKPGVIRPSSRAYLHYLIC